MLKLQQIYESSITFTNANHPDDLKWLNNRLTLVTSFDDFFEEYCYCVVASGFRGSTAGKLAPLLAAQKGNFEKSIAIFKNKQKIKAICSCYSNLSTNYQSVSKNWKVPSDLQSLPFIGSVTCFHLARNIGLCSSVKPDLHLVKIIEKLFQQSDNEFVQLKIKELADKNKSPHGVVDFNLWIYLSHNEGQTMKCCGGKIRLR
ncbi:hypothetical protein SS50377_23277 [Spironucleus salmonicida]|uniref:HhH-GPD domain-containing protein n=1 Tax=Spironucleus salmonicida TaxID=348837 RepID=V6LRC0_9EUKA|nr:hypothetical protein SS50377_23277 [Spironucleus salmonicida]|eukprot:EST47145.1 Hypothetical protein SS50377_12656 [Spironucleus salmonicida]